MSRAGIPLVVVFFSALLLPLSASAESQLWTCLRADGSTMFTDHVPTQVGCRAYTVRSELGFFKCAAEPPAVIHVTPKPHAQHALSHITIQSVIITTTTPPTSQAP